MNPSNCFFCFAASLTTDQQTYDGQEGLPESPKSFPLLLHRTGRSEVLVVDVVLVVEVEVVLSGAPLLELPAQKNTELLVTNDSLLPFWQQHQ